MVISVAYIMIEDQSEDNYMDSTDNPPLSRDYFDIDCCMPERYGVQDPLLYSI